MNKLIQRLIDSDAFCVTPWVHLHISTNGDLNACCIATRPFGNINSNSLKDIWNGDEYQDFRKKIFNNIKDSRCSSCYLKEASGITSLRQHANRNYRHHFLSIAAAMDDTIDKVNVNLPVSWDIRFSNVCNFRCRTCYHGASSRWFEEAARLGETQGDKPIIRAIHDVESFYNQIDESIDEVEEIYFAGGEPLVMEEHYRILEILTNKKSFDKLLKYNTNFSKFTYKNVNVFSIWNQFKKVHVCASLDGSGIRGEFLRKEQNWAEVLSNRELMKKISPNVYFMVTVTVSVLNIFHLPDFHKELVSSNFMPLENFSIENVLRTPDYYSIQILPYEFKLKIKEKFESHIEWIKLQLERDSILYYNNVVEQFENCIHYLFADDLSNLIPSFISRCKILDELRDEKTVDVFPELGFLF
ncbi:twitch domain-containing radical SAM protein [Mucilaginibacter lappiensis]|uniref:Radical SAM protein with 4Fe4S-binding SPASM domain n=1 Tax=Mucilaginibacter lappiensis TaxID=354630 RepID=A0A841JSS0_9SPHI|nr:twitch domain-containing radical SAM protein [Mucilaginibacter lappiensis]MBB6131828.1 radical SAM protein with 4Fe4S-binding SPASM domain [Mucilaginibacter lappiensis]